MRDKNPDHLEYRGDAPAGIVLGCWRCFIAVLAGVDDFQVFNPWNPFGVAIAEIHAEPCRSVIVARVGPIVMWIVGIGASAVIVPIQEQHNVGRSGSFALVAYITFQRVNGEHALGFFQSGRSAKNFITRATGGGWRNRRFGLRVIA